MREAPPHPDRAFIQAHTRLRPVPLAPEIQLHLADESVEIWSRTEEALGEAGLPPPFWAFAWAGGQALCRYVLDQPSIVARRAVLDFAAGSGLAGIAAAKAGASRVTASELDPFAIAAVALNAATNEVEIETRRGDVCETDAGWDIVLAGDVFYEADPSRRIFDWLAQLSARGATVLIGDPGRSYLPQHRLQAIAEYAVLVSRDLEDAESRRARVWRLVEA
ncbi:MAG: methyltransferase [Maricaulaceae bacterium]